MHFAFWQYFVPVSGAELSHLHQLQMPCVLWGSSSAAFDIRRQTPNLDSEFTTEEQHMPTTSMAGACCRGRSSFLFSLEQITPSLSALLYYYCVILSSEKWVSTCSWKVFPKCYFTIYFHPTSYYCGNMHFEFH